MELTDKQNPDPAGAISPFDLGAWAGKCQAFGVVAEQCASAKAACLKQIRDNRWYETLGLNWEQFCTQHAGISRQYADRLINRLEEFGKPFFDLAAIAPVSTDTYRALEPSVSHGSIEIDGEMVAIIPENAARIRKAVQAARDQMRKTRELCVIPNLSELAARFNAWLYDVSITYRTRGNYREETKCLAVLAGQKLQEMVDQLNAGINDPTPIPLPVDSALRNGNPVIDGVELGNSSEPRP